MPKRRASGLGRRFGRWLVIEADKAQRWICRCDCGTEKDVSSSNLVRGQSTSCGCWSREVLAIRSTKHGGSRRGKYDQEYGLFRSMISRCHNPNAQAFHRYGGRGISVGQRWRESYAAFIADMGRRPFPKACLDRIDNDGNYEPGNVRWTDMKTQANNTRRNRLVTAWGRTTTLQAWANSLGLSEDVISARLNLGWQPERAFSVPSRRGRNQYSRDDD